MFKLRKDHEVLPALRANDSNCNFYHHSFIWRWLGPLMTIIDVQTGMSKIRFLHNKHHKVPFRKLSHLEKVLNDIASNDEKKVGYIVCNFISTL